MKYLTIVIVILAITSKTNAQFHQYFDSKTLRLDYFHCGNATTEQFFFDELMEEPHWAGSEINLIDNSGYGTHFIEVKSASDGKLLYTRGYCTLFDEWQTTPEAKNTQRCYPESLVMPFPKEKIKVSILSRTKEGNIEKRFEYDVDPKNYFINKAARKLPVFDIVNSGNPSKKVDIVLIPEGYTEDQQELFKTDCRNFAESMFTYSPYSENKSNFNIRGVWAPSKEAGPDIPGQNIWNDTRLNASYYTFDSERYLMVNDFQGVRDVAGNAPYDFIYILANTEKYGGGAIYNFYGISAAHHISETGKIYAHEFGHLFGGLADEYVGGVEYSEFYPVNIEPWEPNLTTMVNFDKKWKKMLPEGTRIPTLNKNVNQEILGVYEGGGYVTKGVYRPWMNCLMNNLHTIDVFCPVCKKSIQEMIDFQCN